MKTVGVNWAPVRIRHSGRVGDSGHDTFEKKKTGVTLSGIRAFRIRFRPANRVGPRRGATPERQCRDIRVDLQHCILVSRHRHDIE